MKKIELSKAQQLKLTKLKLTIELIPRGSWWNNVRKMVRTKQWDLIRRQVYEASNYKCQVCGQLGKKHPIECHEVWKYSDRTKVQRLLRFDSLCRPCHLVKHIGLARILGEGQEAFNRFKRINKLNQTEALLFESYYWQEWKRRSRCNWRIDVSFLKQYDIDLRETKFKNIKSQKFTFKTKKLFKKSKKNRT